MWVELRFNTNDFKVGCPTTHIVVMFRCPTTFCHVAQFL